MNSKISGSSMSRGAAPGTMLNGDHSAIRKTVRFLDNSHDAVQGKSLGLENNQVL